jgi:hypothetical protein
MNKKTAKNPSKTRGGRIEMSYIVTMLTQGGIVMAADRMIIQSPITHNITGGLPLQSMNHINEFLSRNVQQIVSQLDESNRNFYRVGTKSTKKLFTVGDNIAFSTGQQLHTTKEFYPVELLAEKFCRKNTFLNPKDIAQSLFEYMSAADETMDLVIHLAGYDKGNEDFIPEFYEIKIAEKKCEFMGHTGFMYAGGNDYFTPFTSKIANQVMIYTVQDAVDICCLAIDMSRKLGRYVDLKETISEDYEVIAITMEGLQWVKKAKLEVKQW